MVLQRSEQKGRHLESGVHGTAEPQLGHLTIRALVDIEGLAGSVEERSAGAIDVRLPE